MRKIIDRLPPKLQARCRDNADRILNEEEREVCIEDISRLVEEKSRSLSNPIFGKLPCLEKEIKINKEKRAKSKPDKLGAKQLSFVTISEKDLADAVSSSSSNKSSPANSSKKNCPFCHEDHNLIDCPSFAKVPNQERVAFVMKQRLCFACLRGGHQSRGCHKKKPCTHCHGRHATVMHVHPSEDKHSQRKPEVSSETPVQSSENRSQENISQSNPEQRSAEPSSAEHFCGLTSLEGSVTALPIVPVKIKV